MIGNGATEISETVSTVGVSSVLPHGNKNGEKIKMEFFEWISRQSRKNTNSKMIKKYSNIINGAVSKAGNQDPEDRVTKLANIG